ncbi:neprilysin-21-like [Musca vetustissima]|uniref:neprilysin-21-like n=1 Tax=Musca vetustissima TaxID=27455 RepID=UPI002AB772A4|nr:neprilysin-21-like [Musca vetustissima]
MLIRFRFLLPLVLGVWQIQSSPVQINNETADRKTKAEELLKYMNKSVDSCEDFYDYVCGNYATYNPATIEEPGTGLPETLQSKLDAKIKTILNTDDKDDSDADRKVKSYFRSCLQITDLAEKYPAKLQEIIKEFGEMPALVGDKWQETEFDWLEVVGKIVL